MGSTTNLNWWMPEFWTINRMMSMDTNFFALSNNCSIFFRAAKAWLFPQGVENEETTHAAKYSKNLTLCIPFPQHETQLLTAMKPKIKSLRNPTWLASCNLFNCSSCRWLGWSDFSPCLLAESCFINVSHKQKLYCWWKKSRTTTCNEKSYQPGDSKWPVYPLFRCHLAIEKVTNHIKSPSQKITRRLKKKTLHSSKCVSCLAHQKI